LSHRDLVDHAADLRRALIDPRWLCEALGLLTGYKPVRQGKGVTIRCPAHGDRSPSCSVTLGPDRTIRVRCFACDFAGDALTLIAIARGLDPRRDFRKVLEEAADLTGIALDPGAKPRPARPQRSALLAPPDPPAYPLVAEVLTVWRQSTPVSEDKQACDYLHSRAIDPDTVDLFGLARALPREAEVPKWARCGLPWPLSGHRLLVPMFDADGAMRGIRARSLGPSGQGPKGAAPAGFSTVGLVMADAVGRVVLATGKTPGWFESEALDVVITEGEPDFLTWASAISDANRRPPAVLGVVASAWSSAIAARLPDGARVAIRTHRDPAGEKYALQIQKTLGLRCSVHR